SENRRMTDTGEKFDRINAIPAYQLVADAIEREILARRIRPGEPIGTEAQLVKQFGVNRSTVREGIRLLEQSGLIHRDSGRRLMATLPHYSRLATRMSRAMLLHEVTFRELWEATTALEVATVEQAAEHATEDDIAELEANVASTKAASADPAAVAELDTQFHDLTQSSAAARARALEPPHLSDDGDHSAKGEGRCAASHSRAPENPRCGEGAQQGGKSALDAAPRQGLGAWFRARRQGYRSADRPRLYA